MVLLFRPLLICCLFSVSWAVPQRGRQTAQQQAARIPQGVSKATDGSAILDTTAMVGDLALRYKIAGPPAMFKAASGVPGAQAAPDAQSSMGINVLLHGDGGQSFFAFPNQAVQNNVMGVAVLAPNKNLFWGGGSGLNRVDGVPHSQAVNDLVKNELPRMMAFNQSQVYFTGVSGGSLMLSGYFIPAQMKNYPNSGVLLNCGGMEPQVAFEDSQNVIRRTKIHYQSTFNELKQLQGSIPRSVSAYEKVATEAGMTPEEVGKMQTINNEPRGGHCAFDEKAFSTGVQLMANSFASIIQPGGDGQVQGIGSVLKTVVGNENPSFGAEKRQKI